MLHQARTLQNSRLVGLALKHLSVRTLHNSLQVGCQFHLLSCAVEYVDAFVVIEEQGSVVKVGQAAHECPWISSLRSRIDLGASHIA